MLKKNCPTSVVDLLMKILTNNHLSSDSLKSMRRAVLISKHKNDNDESTALTLLRLLEEKEGTNYYYMTGSYSESLKLVRLRKVCKKKQKCKPCKKKGKVYHETNNHVKAMVNELSLDVDVSDEYLPDECPPDKYQETTEISQDDETNYYVKAVVKGLSLGDGEVLLAVAWVTKEGKEYHTMFPRILGVDVTFGTNNEKRPLCRIVGKTSSNRNFPIINSFVFS